MSDKFLGEDGLICFGCKLRDVEIQDREWALQLWKRFAIGLLVFIAAYLFVDIAFAFPENFRLGYPSCSSCHLAPNGGGALNNYGRSVGNSAMTTFRFKRPDFPDWITAGYNARNVYVKADSDLGEVYKAVDMQREAELAIQPKPGLWVGGTVGVYGNDHIQQLRRSYVLLTFPYASLRAGRLMQSAGIATPDHTDWSRRAWGLTEGQEQYAVEGTVLTPWGELMVSQGAGQKLLGWADSDSGYHVYSAEQNVYTRTSAYLPWWKSQLGASGRWTDGQLIAAGAHIMAAPWTWLFGWAELVRSLKESPVNVSSAKLSVEPYRGIQLFVTDESADAGHRLGTGLALLPFYGLELIGQCKRRWAPRVDECLGMVHVYL